MNPSVTVLLPVCNGTPYLTQAMESVLNQSLTDFELLAIDDASTDGSAEVIGSYRDPRVRLVRNRQNLGQAGSLNLGLQLARGVYVARLDQDDLCLPDRLRQQVSFLERHPEMAACGTWVYWIDSQGRKNGLVGFRIENFGDFLGILMTQATPLGHPTAMFRRQAIADLGGYQQDFSPCEDYELWCRLALRRMSVGIVPRPLVMLRLHPGQQSATRLSLQREKARQAHRNFLAHLSQDGLSPRVDSLLRLEETFWQDCPSGRDVQEALTATQELLTRASWKLTLSSHEEAALHRRLSGWLARGAFLAILRNQRQSLPLYRYAFRTGPQRFRNPAILAYPFLFLLSPLVFPWARWILTDLAFRLNRQRYRVRLIWESWR